MRIWQSTVMHMTNWMLSYLEFLLPKLSFNRNFLLITTFSQYPFRFPLFMQLPFLCNLLSFTSFFPFPSFVHQNHRLLAFPNFLWQILQRCLAISTSNPSIRTDSKMWAERSWSGLFTSVCTPLWRLSSLLTISKAPSLLYLTSVTAITKSCQGSRASRIKTTDLKWWWSFFPLRSTLCMPW